MITFIIILLIKLKVESYCRYGTYGTLVIYQHNRKLYSRGNQPQATPPRGVGAFEGVAANENSCTEEPK